MENSELRRRYGREEPEISPATQDQITVLRLIQHVARERPLTNEELEHFKRMDDDTVAYHLWGMELMGWLESDREKVWWRLTEQGYAVLPEQAAAREEG